MYSDSVQSQAHPNENQRVEDDIYCAARRTETLGQQSQYGDEKGHDDYAEAGPSEPRESPQLLTAQVDVLRSRVLTVATHTRRTCLSFILTRPEPASLLRRQDLGSGISFVPVLSTRCEVRVLNSSAELYRYWNISHRGFRRARRPVFGCESGRVGSVLRPGVLLVCDVL